MNSQALATIGYKTTELKSKIYVIDENSDYEMAVRIWEDGTISFSAVTPGLHPERIQWSKESLEKILKNM